MDDDFVFIVNYTCPRCHAPLEARAIGAPDWLRCPNCGRASLPPDHERIKNPIIDRDTLVIGDVRMSMAALPLRPRAMMPMPSMAAPRVSTARLGLGIGLFLAIIAFVFSLLESNGVLAVITGVAAAFLLYILSRPNRYG